MKEVYNLSKKELLNEFATSKKKGLTNKEAITRLKKYGKNTIQNFKIISWYEILLRQFNSVLVYILLIAVIISLILGETIDAIVIIIIILLNAILGFTQEYHADKSLESLRAIIKSKSKVIRNGERRFIESQLIVPGDILMIEAGDKIPADAVLLESHNLSMDESSLTGESISVKKKVMSLKNKTNVSERKNMVFSGTITSSGSALALVVATASKSEFGKIAKEVLSYQEQLTPLQISLNKFAKKIGFLTIGVCILVFFIGLLKGFFSNTITEKLVFDYFLISVALAVAGIPEGLPAVITASLSIGVNKMAKKNALLRTLPSVETLGATNVICTDKTGTVTKNEMTVKKIFVDNQLLDVSGTGYSKEGSILLDHKHYTSSTLNLLLTNGSLNNNSFFEKSKVIGDPTEAALIVSAEKYGLNNKKLIQEFPKIRENEFDSDRKMMSTIHDHKNQEFVFVKGAVKEVLLKCEKIMINGTEFPLTKKDFKKIMETHELLAKDALRILGFAFKIKNDKNDEEKLIFLGIQGMIDPPRKEIRNAIAQAYSAGVQTILITGDHKTTASAIAKSIGLPISKDSIITGYDLENLSKTELKKRINSTTLFARVTPIQKKKILEILQEANKIIAMTGDGVNDAPALKNADIGVAMGITGTDVAKESADMILLDDNFSTIVQAIKEGRGIYDNIKNFIRYMIPSNSGEILTILLAIIIGWPIPLIPIQILLVNLITDGFPSLALSLDEHSPGLMKQKPRKKKENLISNSDLNHIFQVGIIIGFGTLFLFWLYGLGDYARTVAFTTLVFFQLFNVAALKSEKFQYSIKRNKYLSYSILISILLQLIFVYSPLNIILHLTPLLLMDWLIITIISSSLYFIVATKKEKNLL